MAEALVDRAPPEDLRLDARVLEELGALHQRGLSLVAWKRAVATAPLRTWRGTAQRILAMRLLHATGAPRQASRIAIEAFRADRTGPTACFYMGFETLRRRGPLSTLQFLQPRRIETAQWAVLEARVLLQLRDFDGADRALRRAEQLRPDDAWVRVERGTWFEGQDRYDDALAVAREALGAEPDSLAALHLVAHVLRLHNRDEEARELLAAASARLQNATLPSHLAAIEIDLELYAEARASYDRVVELSPEMELGWAQWLCALRSDAAYFCGDLDAARGRGRGSPTPVLLQL